MASLYFAHLLAHTGSSDVFDHSLPCPHAHSHTQSRPHIHAVKHSIERLDGIDIKVKIPLPTEGAIGVLIGDPCIKSVWKNRCFTGENYRNKQVVHGGVSCVCACVCMCVSEREKESLCPTGENTTTNKLSMKLC